MVDTPWRSVATPDRGGEYLALLSYLPLKIRAQLAGTPGLIGYSFRANLLSHRFWTLSTWEDERP